MPRLTVIGIVIAGFFLTGDVASLVQGGRQLAAGVAGWLQSEQSPISAPEDMRPEPSGGEALSSQAAVAIGPPPVQIPAGLSVSGMVSPNRPQSAGLQIPPTATNRVRLSDLRPGDRLVLWCGNRKAAGGLEILAVDLIDPARGEALLTRQLSGATGSHSLATAVGRTPQRVVLQTHLIERGTAVDLRPVSPGLAVRPTGFSQSPVESLHLGPVVAVQLIPLAE